MNLIDRDKLIEELKKEITPIPFVEENRDMFFHNSGYNCAITGAILLAEKQSQVNQLKPCSEGLPKKEGEYLCYMDNGCYEIVTYSKKYGWIFNYCVEEIIAWQPLPKSYEEKENVD